jgi:DNA polymerase
VGAAGKLLEKLLGEVGLSRADVFIANVLKCRPPGNRDPRPAEIENCTPYLISQIEMVAPRVICTLGNFATKLLRGDPAGITRVHGQPETRTIGSHTTRLFPIYHPAAALYTPRTMETLREDFRALPAILRLSPPVPPVPPVQPVPGNPAAERAVADEPARGPEPATATAGAQGEAAAEQLGLF